MQLVFEMQLEGKAPPVGGASATFDAETEITGESTFVESPSCISSDDRWDSGSSVQAARDASPARAG